MTVDVRRAYDETIERHYRNVAEDCGLSGTSTMADEITRRLETDAILGFVSDALDARRAAGLTNPATIVDVGCGNGYTLERLSERYADQSFVGIEKSDALRSLASSRFTERSNVRIIAGDIRNPAFAEGNSADILVCQRVLINLLDPDDQGRALQNILAVLRDGVGTGASGKCMFIEAFTVFLDKLNNARSEFDLPPIPPAHHNLYLPENFFPVAQLRPFTAPTVPPPNFLSTHYYVTRVLHPLVIGDKPVMRNSEFVRFFSEALGRNVGDYSPLRLHAFEKVPEPAP